MKISSAFSAFFSSGQLAITKDDIKTFKSIHRDMRGKRMNALAMFLLTEETIYRVSIETIDRAIRIVKKVIKCGCCHYDTGSKTESLLSTFKKVNNEYQEMMLKMRIKMMPSRAVDVIEAWLKKDAADNAARGQNNLPKEVETAAGRSETIRTITEIIV